MIKHTVRLVFILLASFMFLACGQKLDLEVKARIDGQPVSQAKVLVDGKELGVTDANGNFAETIRKEAGAESEVQVIKQAPGYHIQPWKTTFLVKLPNKGQIDKYAFNADLEATRYITLAVTEKDAPLSDANVKLNKKKLGKTDAIGEFVVDYKKMPSKGLALQVNKPGYTSWSKTAKVEPGQRLEVALTRRAIVTITALTEEYGRTSTLRGVTVRINKRRVGKTNSKGVYTYVYKGKAGKRARLTLSLPGYTPRRWRTTVTLNGLVNIKRYFYPTTPKPIRTGLFRFVDNTPGVDLADIVAQTERAVETELYKYSVFRKVPRKTLQDKIKQANLNIERITTKGWHGTRLRRTADMIVLGSVAKDDKGFLIEAKFYTSRGKLIHSQISRARSAGAIRDAARDIARNVIERFPFEGTVVKREGNRFLVNIGRPYRIRRGTEFTLTAANLGKAGKVTSYRKTGSLLVKRSKSTGAWTEVDRLLGGARIHIGDRVVRRVYHEGEQKGARNYVVLSVKGGLGPDVAPLRGVNVYLNNDWVGETGANGKVKVPIRLRRSYELVLYRHGYQQVSETLKIAKNKDTKEFVLGANNSLFKVDSEPSGAIVYVDGESIGDTPILAGKLINLGFHTVKLTRGEDYREWEEVLEFANKVEDRTGARKIVLRKDYLKVGEKAVQRGDIDAAIQAYSSTESGHPDYSEAHHRLAQLYLDEKGDYDGSIREFENVLSLPENQQLIYKQFAVAFTNLGHAYHEKGNALVRQDRDAAAQNFAKAVQKLQVAKQNTRFLPTRYYDEALHDTYYYLALSYHKLYLVTKKSAIKHSANLAWREYFDFYPKKLEGVSDYEQSRQAARSYWDQIREE